MTCYYHYKSRHRDCCSPNAKMRQHQGFDIIDENWKEATKTNDGICFVK